MSEYRPKTLPVQREGITKFFTATQSGGAQWWTDEVSAAVVDDLTHAEAIIRERDAEIERLRSLIASLLKAGDAAIKGDYSEWDSLKPEDPVCSLCKGTGEIMECLESPNMWAVPCPRCKPDAASGVSVLQARGLH